MGMFDGAIQQAQKMIDEEMTTGPASQLFNKLTAELDGLKANVAAGAAVDAGLDQHLLALDQHIQASNALQAAQNAQLKALVQALHAANAHPAAK